MRFTKADKFDINNDKYDYGENGKNGCLLSQIITEYNQLIEDGVRKEQARKILPLGTYTEFLMGIDTRNIYHLFEERLASDAQKETREVANMMLEELRNHEYTKFIVNEVWKI